MRNLINIHKVTEIKSVTFNFYKNTYYRNFLQII